MRRNLGQPRSGLTLVAVGCPFLSRRLRNYTPRNGYCEGHTQWGRGFSAVPNAERGKGKVKGAKGEEREVEERVEKDVAFWEGKREDGDGKEVEEGVKG